MLLAVAGLNAEELKQRTQLLAARDWSAFTQAEALAFAFAEKLSKEPASVTASEVKALVAAFGKHRALDVVWYVSWCNYMNRISDALQLQLERENVFADPAR